MGLQSQVVACTVEEDMRGEERPAEEDNPQLAIDGESERAIQLYALELE